MRDKIVLFAQEPALGRLHRFDAIGPRAYGGPAVVVDSRINP
jgi:hypothetical protein